MAATETPPHIPVLLRPLLAAVAPVQGVWLDGTFGAGGYTRALLDAGAARVIAVDRDPLAFEMATPWAGEYGDRLVMQLGVFSKMDEYAQDLDGIVLDLGVSSMQLDLAERGFSFMRDGPLDMRMSQDGPSAADLVNESTEEELADILYLYGEERASRRIARKIVEAREVAPITRTLELTRIVESCLPRAKPGQSHPATRSFQALRIAVNDEYGELWGGLMAAERALETRRNAGRRDLPFGRGPDGETLSDRAGRGGWQCQPLRPRDGPGRTAIHDQVAQGDRAGRPGAGREPAQPERQVAGCHAHGYARGEH